MREFLEVIKMLCILIRVMITWLNIVSTGKIHEGIFGSDKNVLYFD